MTPTIAILTIEKLSPQPVEFVYLELDQCFNDHHRARIILDLERIDENVLSAPLQKASLVNEKIHVDIQEGADAGNAYSFIGLITDIQIELDKGNHGLMHIYAASPTIELERGKILQTFSDTDLESIVGEVSKGLVNLKMVNKPKYGNPIRFSMQYKETDFQYIRRLAWMYGEKLFFSGDSLVFGEHKTLPVVNLTYDLDLAEVKICTRLVANTVNQYYHTIDYEKSPYEHPLSESGTFAGNANAQSARLNLGKKPEMPMDVPVFDEGSLQEITKMRKERNYTDMYHVTGQTKVYRVRIGGLLNVNFHGRMQVAEGLGTLRVIRVRHIFEPQNAYYNEFDAVPEKFNRIPFPDMDVPVAHAIPAKVVANEDPDGLGKVQVRFDFDKRDCDYWMPVMMPEAGGPQNRGYIFVPEVNDMVLISFFDGNPEFPFVMGSMFHGKNGKGIGGGAGNHIKSMRDKSGTEVVLNDKEGSAKMFSPKGNSTIFLDGKGNVSISTPKTITLSAMDINLNAGNSINLAAKPNSEGGEGFITINAKKYITSTTQIEGITFSSKDDVKIESLNANVIIESANADIELSATSNIAANAEYVTVQAGENVDVIGGKKTVITGGKIEMNQS